MSEEQEGRLKEQTIFYILGYGKWVSWGDLDPSPLQIVKKFPKESSEVFSLLSSNKIIEATLALRIGPWKYQDLGSLLPELDVLANLDPDRESLGPVTTKILRILQKHGLESYHESLLEKHKESSEATEALKTALEKVGLEMWDTGAMYSREGEQEGPRDLVMGVPGTDTEYSFRVYHSPRKAEFEGSLPLEVKRAVEIWETSN